MKPARIIISLIYGALFVVFFSGAVHEYNALLQFVPKSQFMPALLKSVGGITIASFAAVFVTVLAALFFGRVYCSAVCPLGIFQDFFIFLRYKINPKNKFKYSKGYFGFHLVMLAAAVLAYAAGFISIMSVLEPYSAASRSAASFLSRSAVSAGVFWYSVFFVLFMAAAAFIKGRLFCNTLCPAGAVLALIAKKSVYKIKINENNCTHCNRCEAACKAGCIDHKNLKVDFERCVGCFNCISACKDDAIGYEKVSVIKKDNAKRKTIKKLAFFTVAAAGLTFFSKDLFAFKSVIPVKKSLPVLPPGAGSIHHYNSHCTACHACVSACPQKVIAANVADFGALKLMQPVMNYSASYCLYSCNECTKVCPTGALEPVLIKEKKSVQLGRVHLIKENCISWSDHKPCTVCTEHCPTKAVYSVLNNGIAAPEILPDICIGCGACEYVCPAVPHKAIFVDGLKKQGKAGDPVKASRPGEWKLTPIKNEKPSSGGDFPF